MTRYNGSLKERAASAAVNLIEKSPHTNFNLGVGTGSTAECFIQLLPKLKHRIRMAIASSTRTEYLLNQLNVPYVNLTSVSSVDFYVDGADEINNHLQLVKGGGAALTREKIIAAVSKTFICIADESKRVSCLGKFPLPVEVIPMARSHVEAQLVMLGGKPTWREGVITDNGNIILDVHGFSIENPIDLESRLNQIVGVVTNGIFAARSADIALVANASGVDSMISPKGLSRG